MTFDSKQIERLSSNPKALAHFRAAFKAQATVCGIDKEIRKLSDSLREQMDLARVLDLDASALLKQRREDEHALLLACGYAVGQERGERLGRAAAKTKISTARKFAAMHVASLAPFLGED